MTTSELMLIDVSGLAHATFHVSGNEPDPSYISNTIIARVRAIASQHPHAAICCDSGKSFRKDIDPQYKAGRDTENRAVIGHQLGVALDVLKRDGFVVWSVPGFEADDLIATAVREALAIEDTTVLVVSEDKDLLQIVSDRVTQRKFDGSVRTPAEVVARFKVKPEQMGDYLCLVGDVSDNVKGAKGIGGVTAAKLLNAHGSIKAIYEAMQHGVAKELTPALRSSMAEFQDRWPTVAQLIALRTDAPIPFAEIAAERVAAPMVEEEQETIMEEPSVADVAEFVSAGKGARESMVNDTRELSRNDSLSALSEATASVAKRVKEQERENMQTVMDGPRVSAPQSSTFPVKADTRSAAPATIIEAPPPPEWELQLQPRTYRDLRLFAADAQNSRKYLRNFGSAEAAIMAVMSGRELGVPAMASLRSFHSVEDGPPMPNADLVRSIIIKSGKVEYFDPTERTATAAEFAIKRVGRPEVKLRYTIEEGRTAYGFDVPMNDNDKRDLEKKWAKSGWGKNPADMLVARSSMKLGRLVCPDVCAGLYAKEEFDV